MSLWHAEVEKSKFNPNASSRYQRVKRRTVETAPTRSAQLNKGPDKTQLTWPDAQPQLIGKTSIQNTTRDFATERDTLLRENSRLRQRLRMAEIQEDHAPMPTKQENVDQIAQLIIQKTQLEEDMRTREAKYESLLRESQELLKQMLSERDGLITSSSKASDPAAQMPQVTRSLGTPDSVEPPLDFDVIFRPNDDFQFRTLFQEFESSLKQFVLASLKSQPDAVAVRDLTPSMDYYVAKHNLSLSTVFGIRDVRCIVCRGFCIEFLLERIFRVFLFGLGADHGHSYYEASSALSAAGPGRGSRWAATVARQLIRSSAEYRPSAAAEVLIAELQTYLAPLVPDPDLARLRAAVGKAIEVARACRLDYAIFSLDLPAHAVDFDPSRMDASAREDGPVAVAYAPAVSRRGNRYGEDYHHPPAVVVKARVWRVSVLEPVEPGFTAQQTRPTGLARPMAATAPVGRAAGYTYL